MDKNNSEFIDKLVHINRITKVVKVEEDLGSQL